SQPAPTRSAPSRASSKGVSPYGPSHVSVSRMYSTCVSEWRVPLMNVTAEIRGQAPWPRTISSTPSPFWTVMTVQNGLGVEEIVRGHGAWPLISAVTFMSGTRHSDTHVEYILDTETWLGPYGDTPFELAREGADLVGAGWLRALAFPDLRPAQWSKLIFNATVNSVSALTGLPHDAHFAARGRFS